jgi:hypothetical protein
MKPIFLLIFFALLGLSVQAQYFPLDIPVVRQGKVLPNPWAGGLDAPQYSTLDVNNDGIMDLLVFDRLTETSMVYINRGTQGQIDYVMAPAYNRLVPQMRTTKFLLARDYNGDGIGDLIGMRDVAGSVFPLAVWKGYRNADDSLRFQRVIDDLTYDASPSGGSRYQDLYVFHTDLPGLDDVDGDGDLDIFSFPGPPYFPNNITFYENKTADYGYNPDTMAFYMGSECWGLMSEELDSAKVMFGPKPDSCYNNTYFNDLTRSPQQLQQYIRDQYSMRRGARHVGTNITLVDYNGDSSMDVVLSEVEFKNANMLTSTTVNDTVWMIGQQPRYPLYDKPVDIYSFPGIFFLDINNDGIKDMLAAPSETEDKKSVTDSVTWLYKNVGTNRNMTFEFQQKDFLVDGMIDVGRRAHPVLLDYDGDGLQDLLIGGQGRVRENTQHEYGMVLYRNVGTATLPTFQWITNDFIAADSLQLLELYPTLGDLDGDGDQDMICGAEDGHLIYFENVAGANQPMRFATPIRNFSNIYAQENSAPQLFDLDRDGDLDLLVGGISGRIRYHENTGNSLSAVFASVPTNPDLGNYITAYPDVRYSKPFAYDNQGSYELIIGQAIGHFLHLDSIDNNVLGTYAVRSSLFKGLYKGRHAQLAVTDINNDGKKEYLIGTGAGGVAFMNEVDSFVAATALPAALPSVQLYPNPAQERVTLDFQRTVETPLQLTIYNALGQVLAQETTATGRSQQQLSLKGLPSGVLFIEIKGQQEQQTLRLIKR